MKSTVDFRLSIYKAESLQDYKSPLAISGGPISIGRKGPGALCRPRGSEFPSNGGFLGTSLAYGARPRD